MVSEYLTCFLLWEHFEEIRKYRKHRRLQSSLLLLVIQNVYSKMTNVTADRGETSKEETSRGGNFWSHHSHSQSWKFSHRIIMGYVDYLLWSYDDLNWISIWSFSSQFLFRAVLQSQNWDNSGFALHVVQHCLLFTALPRPLPNQFERAKCMESIYRR